MSKQQLQYVGFKPHKVGAMTHEPPHIPEDKLTEHDKQNIESLSQVAEQRMTHEPKCELTNMARYRRIHPDRVAASKRIWVKRNQEKRSAHRTVEQAVRTGLLVRPNACSKCGDSGLIESSHDDYSKPLEVEWLCIPCHRRKDAANRPRKPRTKFFDAEGRLQCTGCKAWLAVNCFHKNLSRPFGYNYYCKKCVAMTDDQRWKKAKP